MFRKEILHLVLRFKVFYLNCGLPTELQKQNYLYLYDSYMMSYRWDITKLELLTDKQLLDLYIDLLNNYKNYRVYHEYMSIFD